MHQYLARRVSNLAPALVGSQGLCACLGGRGVFSSAPGGGRPGLLGGDWAPCRLPIRPDCAGGQVPGVERALGRPPARPEGSGDARPGASYRRWCPGLLAGVGRKSVPRPGSNAAGTMNSPTSSTNCPSPSTRGTRPCSTRSSRLPIRASAREAVTAFAREFEPRYPKAVACLTHDQETLFTLHDFPPNTRFTCARRTGSNLNWRQKRAVSIKPRRRVEKCWPSFGSSWRWPPRSTGANSTRCRGHNAPDFLPFPQAGARSEDATQARDYPETMGDSIPAELPARVATFQAAIHNIRNISSRRGAPARLHCTLRTKELIEK